MEGSGNPSRFGRADNLFGYTTIRECLVAVVNPLLESYNLPPFELPPVRGRHTDGAGLTLASSDSQSSDSAYLTHGPQITRVHLAQNYEVGPDASAVLRALEQQNWHGRSCNRHGAGSLSWGSRRSLRIKWYDKAKEIRSHRTKCPDHADHRDRLASYLESVGALRYEIEINRDALRRYGLRELRSWSEERAIEIMQQIQTKMMPSVGAGGFDAIADQLIEQGVSPRLALTLQGMVYQWMGGVDVFAKLAETSLSTAYRYRSMIKSVGYDIRQPCNTVTSLRVQPRVADIRPACPPAWYQLPRVCA